MSFGSKAHEELICAAAVLAVVDGKAVQSVRLLPFGEIKLRDKRGPYKLPPEEAQNVIDASLAYAGAQELPIDYDHQMIFNVGDGKGGTAIASGWMKSLKVGDDGIYASIEWTPTASEKIKNKEYRYISPGFFANPKTGIITRIQNAGLVNEPAIDGLDVLAASLNQKKETQMDKTQLAAALGLGADATEEQILAAIKKNKADLVAAHANADLVKTALGAKDAANTQEVVAAAAALMTKKTPGEGEIIVPASVWTDSQSRLAALEGDKIATAVDKAITDGKIVPAQKEQMLDWAKKDFVACSAFLANAPQIIAPGATIEGQTKTNDKGLTEIEVAAAKAYGISEDEFVAARAAIEEEA